MLFSSITTFAFLLQVVDRVCSLFTRIEECNFSDSIYWTFILFSTYSLELPKTFEDQYDPLARNALAEVVWGLGETSQTFVAGVLTILTLWPWYYTVGERYYEGYAVKGNFVWDQVGFMIGLKIMPSLQLTILFMPSRFEVKFDSPMLQE